MWLKKIHHREPALDMISEREKTIRKEKKLAPDHLFAETRNVINLNTT